MREILFRGKKKRSREWVYGGAVQGVMHELWQNSDRAYITVFPKYLSSVNLVEIDPSTLGQYTGITDKNGRKIFEGDIVRATFSYNNMLQDKVDRRTEIYEVKYHIPHCYFYLARERNNLLFDGGWQYFLKEIEVIGNIHDNDLGDFDGN